MTGTVKEIVEAKRKAGEEAYLWLTHTGICALFQRESDSCETGVPLQRWELDPIEREQLTETGLVDGMGVLGCNGETTYEKVEDICLRMLQDSEPTDPTLFDRITNQLISAGVIIDQSATAKSRAESPNVVAVFESGEGDERDYIEVIGREATIWGYSGEIQAELLTLQQVQHYYEDPPITLKDLADLRFIEREGQKLYDEADLSVISEKKTGERKARREKLRTLTLVLPDEFLQLCEEVEVPPAAILQGFIADLCHLEERPYITSGSDERLFAEQYFDRCGYRFRAEDTEAGAKIDKAR